MLQIDLSGHRALVCGASKGIGKATAQAFSECGAEVVLCARNAEALEEVRCSLVSPEKHQSLALDLADSLQIKAQIESILADQPIDILVCNSGGPAAGPIAEAQTENFEQAFRQHIVANQILLQAVLPGMKEKSYGRVINIISTSVKAPIANLGVSNTIRGAVASWAKSLANELAGDGITVNNILPGYTATERLENLVAAAAKKQNKPQEQVIREWKNKVPVGRFAEPQETAAAIAFLASPLASYINGINLPVDGGRLGSL